MDSALEICGEVRQTKVRKWGEHYRCVGFQAGPELADTHLAYQQFGRGAGEILRVGRALAFDLFENLAELGHLENGWCEDERARGWRAGKDERGW